MMSFWEVNHKMSSPYHYMWLDNCVKYGLMKEIISISNQTEKKNMQRKKKLFLIWVIKCFILHPLQSNL